MSSVEEVAKLPSPPVPRPQASTPDDAANAATVNANPTFMPMMPTPSVAMEQTNTITPANGGMFVFNAATSPNRLQRVALSPDEVNDFLRWREAAQVTRQQETSQMEANMASTAPNNNSGLIYNNAPVDFSSQTGVIPVNREEAFRVNNKGEERRPAAKRQALSRGSRQLHQMYTSIGDNENDRNAALLGFLARPDMKANTMSVAMSNPKVKAAMDLSANVGRMWERAVETDKSRARVSDDRQSFAQSLESAAVGSPDREGGASLRSIGGLLGMSAATTQRKLSAATKKRKRHKDKDDAGLLWSQVPKRRGHSQFTDEFKAKLHEWFLNCPHVVTSPIKGDTLLVMNNETGKKERVSKLLLEIPFRELHNLLISPVSEGGFAEARDKSGKVVISDTALRYLAPPQLRKMTARHKQMCGCEMCITIRSLQLSLNAFRVRYARTLQKSADDAPAGANKDSLQAKATEYRNAAFVGGDLKSPLHLKPNDALEAMQCQPIAGLGYRHWKCSTGSCEDCPNYPVPTSEQTTDDTAPTIFFHQYLPFTRCSEHGTLELRSKECAKCNDLPNGVKRGKIRTRKHLTRCERPIGKFMVDIYLPKLLKYAYHFALFVILSKNACGKLRDEAFRKNVGSVKTIRDYAERLDAKFNLEIQTEHFGNGRSLSLEGVSCRTHAVEAIQALVNGETIDESTRLHFHSHFSDYSRQDAATTTAHLNVLLDSLEKSGEMGKNGTMFDDTDGCSKQYRCAKAYFLLSQVAIARGITIDRAIGAPGHGKDLVDALNAIDKHFLGRKMCLIGTPEANESECRMEAASMIERGNASKSLAEECARLCRDPSRQHGVKGYKKHAKREANATMKERTYHVQDPADVKYKNLKIQADKMPKGIGLMECHHIRAEPELGLGVVAMRRIPCACDGCLEQLAKPWLPGLDASKQPRFAKGNKNCHWWSMFEGLNDWHIVELHRVRQKIAAVDEIAGNEYNEAQDVVLDAFAVRMAEDVVAGRNGAFMTEDPDTDGYYVVEWSSSPYTLQEDVELDEFDPPLRLSAGELVVDAHYYNKVPTTRKWYTRSALATVVRMKQVVAADLEMHSISDTNKLPSVCSRHTKREATSKGAKRVADDDVDAIAEEIATRTALDYDELSDESDEDSEEESDEESDEEASDTEEE
jgi:hypothetical protein